MLQRIYELVTGRPYITIHSATAEFGPPPGARYADELNDLTDAELYAYGTAVVADLRSRQPALR